MKQRAERSKVLIFHGTGGSPEGNWFPWLKQKLVQRWCKVFIPKFPDPRQGNSLPAWLKILKKYEGYIDENTILVGHSLGGLFLLRVLERIKKPIKAAFLVATSIGVKPILYYESDKLFSGFDFDWTTIKSKARHFEVFHSDNDPYVSLGNGEELAKHLGVKLTFISKAGHINAESGYTEMKPLLKKILRIL